jgi:hypothetical protein
LFEINRLTDFDFEAVSKDIFESHLNIPLEIFTPGPDGGIDLRYLAEQQHRGLIIQCKHWVRSSRSALIQHMKRVELAKIKAVNPDRYILATSVPLTPAAKDKLMEALHPYLRSPGDIYGLQEIESLLQSHPEIVRRHLRLWLNSSAVLQSLLNKKILTRSFDLAEDARQAMLVYVPNQSYYRASEILESEHLCIISGLPGIGKTTLAQVLSVTYANSGYEVFEISEDADEINAVWDDRAAQLFYYDDFLGQTTLDDKLHKNEDSRLLRLLRRVNHSTNKRMILTTREYILEQARQRYERIGAEDFSPLTTVLSLNDYTDVIRAEILYNHVYFSELAEDDKALFAEPSIYKRIITSPKFNPRLIDYSIRASIARGDRGNAVTQEIFDNLATPRRIWEHIVLHQLDSLSVQILVVLFSFRQHVLLNELARAVEAYPVQGGNQLNDREFRKSLKVLDGTMVRITPESTKLMVEYHNPSINDYMREYVFGSDLILLRLLSTIDTFSQLQHIWLYFDRWRMAKEKLELPEIRATIIEVAIRIFKGDIAEVSAGADIRQDQLFGRSSTILEIAEKLDSDQIRELIREWFCSVDMYEVLPDTDDLVTLLKEMLTSNSASIKRLVFDSLDTAIEYITEDTSDWRNANAAKDALEDLENSVPVAIGNEIRARITSIEEKIDDHARYWIERAAEIGEVPSYMEDLDEMIAYAKQYGDPEESFPGLSVAEDVAYARQTSAPTLHVSREPNAYATRPENDKIIRRMLGMLRNSDR